MKDPLFRSIQTKSTISLNSLQGLETFGQTLWSCSNAGAGVGLLDFLRIGKLITTSISCSSLGHSWSVHLIFSLLKGRPVIIYAEKENEDMVRNIVQALSIFVAFQQNTGPRGGGDPGEEIVIPWYNILHEPDIKN